jgi:hypothetical protein
VNKTEALKLIGILSAAGLMHVQQDQADVWALALEDIRFNDSMTAARELITHRTGAERWVTPADVRHTVRKLRNDVISRMEKDRLPPRDLADDSSRERQWIRAWNQGVGDGLTADDATHQADIMVMGAPRQAIEANGRTLAELAQYAIPKPKKTPQVLPPRIPNRDDFLAELEAAGIPTDAHPITENAMPTGTTRP